MGSHSHDPVCSWAGHVHKIPFGNRLYLKTGVGTAININQIALVSYAKHPARYIEIFASIGIVDIGIKSFHEQFANSMDFPLAIIQINIVQT